MTDKQVRKFHKLRNEYDFWRTKTNSLTWLDTDSNEDYEFNLNDMAKQAQVVKQIQELLKKMPKEEVTLELNIDITELPDDEAMDIMLTGELAAILGFPLKEGNLVLINYGETGIYIYRDKRGNFRHEFFDYEDLKDLPEHLLDKYTEKEIQEIYGL